MGVYWRCQCGQRWSRLVQRKPARWPLLYTFQLCCSGGSFLGCFPVRVVVGGSGSWQGYIEGTPNFTPIVLGVAGDGFRRGAPPLSSFLLYFFSPLFFSAQAPLFFHCSGIYQHLRKVLSSITSGFKSYCRFLILNFSSHRIGTVLITPFWRIIT